MTTLKLIGIFAIFLCVLPLVKGTGEFKGDDEITGAYCASGYVTGVRSNLTSVNSSSFTCSDGSQPVSFNYTSSTLPQHISDLNNRRNLNDAIVVGFVQEWPYQGRLLCEKSSAFDLDVMADFEIQGDVQSFQCPPNTAVSRSVFARDNLNATCTNLVVKSPLANAMYNLRYLWCSNGFFTNVTPDLVTGNGTAQCLWNMNAKSKPQDGGPFNVVKGTSVFTPISALINVNSANGITSNVTTFACGAGEAAFSISTIGIRYRGIPSPSSLFKTIFTGEQNFYCDQVHLSQGYSLISSVSSNPSNVLSFYCPNGFLSGLSQIITTMSDGSSTTSYSYTCVTPVLAADPLAASVASSASNNTGTSNENQQSYAYVANENGYQSTTYQGSPQGQVNYGTSQTGAQQGQGNYGTSQTGAQQGQGNYGTSQTGAQQGQVNDSSNSQNGAQVNDGSISQTGTQQGQNSYGDLGSYKNIADVYSSNATVDIVSSSLLRLIMVYLIAILT